MGHLSALTVDLVNKGRLAGTDLPIEIRFSNHVATRRAKHGEMAHVHDHHGTARIFDAARYALSLQLPRILPAMLQQDALCFETQSYGGTKNLISLRTDNSAEWAIVFCFHPKSDRMSLQMDILSAHEKMINQRQISRKTISYFARKCLFEQRRIP